VVEDEDDEELMRKDNWEDAAELGADAQAIWRRLSSSGAPYLWVSVLHYLFAGIKGKN
jgi:hypothetical protein